jgi:hypothetical protein
MRVLAYVLCDEYWQCCMLHCCRQYASFVKCAEVHLWLEYSCNLISTLCAAITSTRHVHQVDMSDIIAVLQESQTLIINYSASCLMVPGMFDEPEEAPTVLLSMMLLDDTTNSGTSSSNGLPSGYLQLVLKALEEQEALDEVIMMITLTITTTLYNI